jgi:hypothetical protein
MKSYNCSESDFVLINSQELDAFIEETKPAKQDSVKLPGLEQLWNAVLQILTRSPEPKIYQKHDRHGKLYFQVYDPIAHRTSTFSTEQEVRIWLDQRYYS